MSTTIIAEFGKIIQDRRVTDGFRIEAANILLDRIGSKFMSTTAQAKARRKAAKRKGPKIVKEQFGSKPGAKVRKK